MEVIEEHLNLKTPDELADYLEKRGAEIDTVEGNTISGYYKDIAFNIVYQYGVSMSIYVPSDEDETLSDLKRIVAPVMWHKDESCLDDGIYAPTIEYETDDVLATAWSYKDPVKFIIDFFVEAKRYEDQWIDVRPLYPGYSVEYFENESKYGVYEGYLTEFVAKNLKKFSEIEIYCLIERYFELYDRQTKDPSLSERDRANSLDAISYCLARLAQETKRFGVEMHEPTIYFELDSPEFYAWEMWWQKGFEKIANKNPKIRSLMFTGKDLSGVKPKGDYHDYVEDVIKQSKEIEEYEAHLTEQLISDIEEFAKEDAECFEKPYLRLVTDDEDDDDNKK